MMMTRFLVLCSFVVVVGCADPAPTLDTSDSVTLMQSHKQLNAELSEAEQEKLTAAMSALLAHQMAVFGDGEKTAIQTLNGLTAAEIIDKAKPLIDERERLKAEVDRLDAEFDAQLKRVKEAPDDQYDNEEKRLQELREQHHEATRAYARAMSFK